MRFCWGYYSHLITDAAFQVMIRDEDRVREVWMRIKADEELSAAGTGMDETWDSVKRLIPKKDRMREIYAMEAEYLSNHPNSGYITEILPQYITKAAYIVLGIQLDGHKDILGVWIGEHESAKFWLSVMNDLRNCGIKDVYVFCVDGLNGFREAINAAFPHSQIQRCIIHQIRSSTKYVSYKDIKAVMADLKKIYQAINEDEARNALIQFKENWAKTYPSCVRSWEENWDILSTFFAYPAEVRKIIYTTNIIEGLNRQFRKITKNKPSFTNDDSLRKILYLASKNIVEHWTSVCRNWDMVSNQLSIMFAERNQLSFEIFLLQQGSPNVPTVFTPRRAYRVPIPGTTQLRGESLDLPDSRAMSDWISFYTKFFAVPNSLPKRIY